MTDTAPPDVPDEFLDAGDDDAHAPADLVELHEVLEWTATVGAAS